METTLMEVHSIEVGDIVVVGEMTYEVVDIAGYESYDLIVYDEEGFQKVITANGTDRIRLVVEDDSL